MFGIRPETLVPLMWLCPGQGFGVIDFVVFAKLLRSCQLLKVSVKRLSLSWFRPDDLHEGRGRERRRPACRLCRSFPGGPTRPFPAAPLLSCPSVSRRSMLHQSQVRIIVSLPAHIDSTDSLMFL